MSAAVWALLSEPFSRAATAWRVVEVADDLQSARLERFITAEAIAARLDDAVGAGRWSYQLLPLGERALVCNLTVDGAGRSAVASAIAAPVPLDADDLAARALAAAAALFGMRAAAGSAPSSPAWVDFDAERGTPLYLPEDEDAGPADVVGVTAPERSPVLERSEAPGGGAKPAGHEVIERLLDRLREEGLGKEAARLVVTHGGYGRDQAEARELYGKLRALLKGSVVQPT